MAKKDYKRKTSNDSNNIRLEQKAGYNQHASLHNGCVLCREAKLAER